MTETELAVIHLSVPGRSRPACGGSHGAKRTRSTKVATCWDCLDRVAYRKIYGRNR